MSVTVKGRVPSKWDDNTALHITERLRALEKAVAGGVEIFRSPAAPPTGPTIIVTPGSGGTGGPGTGGVTDHGDLTGLGDDDHPQYAQRFESIHPSAHVHSLEDIRGERPVLATAHVHHVEEKFVPPMAHVHRAEDIIGGDVNPGRLQPQPEPDWWSVVMFSRVFGG